MEAQRSPDVRRGGPEPPNSSGTPYWKQSYGPLGAYLGEHAQYKRIHDPVELRSDDPVVSSLADELADSHSDLKRGLGPWDAADAATRREIVWTWRFLYGIHWAAMRSTLSMSFTLFCIGTTDLRQT